MRRYLVIPIALSMALAGCIQSGYCVDYAPNATVTDVLHEELSGQLYVSLYHRFSYCTGTDEKRYGMGLIQVDLASGEVAIEQRSSDELEPFALPQTCCSLYRDGGFSGTSCQSCELILQTADQLYTAHFVTGRRDSSEPVMTLEVSREGTPVVTIDIDGYTVRAH